MEDFSSKFTEDKDKNLFTIRRLVKRDMVKELSDETKKYLVCMVIASALQTQTDEDLITEYNKELSDDELAAFLDCMFLVEGLQDKGKSLTDIYDIFRRLI